MLSQRRSTFQPIFQVQQIDVSVPAASSASPQLTRSTYVYKAEFFEVDFGRDVFGARVYWSMGRCVHAQNECKENQ